MTEYLCVKKKGRSNLIRKLTDSFLYIKRYQFQRTWKDGGAVEPTFRILFHITIFPFDGNILPF